MDEETCSVADSTITSRSTSLSVIFDKMITGEAEPKQEVEEELDCPISREEVVCMDTEENLEETEEISDTTTQAVQADDSSPSGSRKRNAAGNDGPNETNEEGTDENAQLPPRLAPGDIHPYADQCKLFHYIKKSHDYSHLAEDKVSMELPDFLKHRNHRDLYDKRQMSNTFRSPWPRNKFPVPFYYCANETNSVRYLKRGAELIKALKEKGPHSPPPLRSFSPSESAESVPIEVEMTGLKNPHNGDRQGAVLGAIVAEYRFKILVEVLDYTASFNNCELRYLEFDLTAQNVLTGKFRNNGSRMATPGALMWIFGIAPTKACHLDPEGRLRRAALQDDTEALEPCFRVERFAWLPPSLTDERLAICKGTKGCGGNIIRRADLISGTSPVPIHAGVKTGGFHVAFGQHVLAKENWLVATCRQHIYPNRFLPGEVSVRNGRWALRELLSVLPLGATIKASQAWEIRDVSDDEYDWIQDRKALFNRFEDKDTPGLMDQTFGAGINMMFHHRADKEDLRLLRCTMNAVITDAPKLFAELKFQNVKSSAGWDRNRRVVIYGKEGYVMPPMVFGITSATFKAVNGELTVSAVCNVWDTNIAKKMLNELADKVDEEDMRYVELKGRLIQEGESCFPVRRMVLEEDFVEKALADAAFRERIQLLYGHRRAYDVEMNVMKLPNATGLSERPIVVRRSGREPLHLELHQNRAVSAITSKHPFFLVQAPFGSGKTQLTVAAILEYLLKYEDAVIIVSATTNAAVWQLIAMFLSLEGHEKARAIRFVSDAVVDNTEETSIDLHKVMKQFAESDPDLTDEERNRLNKFISGRERVIAGLKDPLLMREMNKEDAKLYRVSESNCGRFAAHAMKAFMDNYLPRVVFCTNAAILNLFGPGGALQGYSEKIKMALLDEASQMPEVYLMGILKVLPHIDIRLVGDDLQLGPFVPRRRTSEAAVAAHRSSMRVLLQSAAIGIVTLKVSYRAHPRLTHFVGKLFYQDMLIAGCTVEERGMLNNLCGRKSTDLPVVWIENNSEASQRSDGFGSLRNEGEAIIVADLVERLNNQGISTEDLMIICLYRAQVEHVTALFESRNLAARVDTVDSAQGSEANLVFLLTSIHSKMSREGQNEEEEKQFEEDSRFVDECERITVAISRARHGLIIVGSKEALCHGTKWAKMYNEVVEQGELISTKEELANLFKESDW